MVSGRLEDGVKKRQKLFVDSLDTLNIQVIIVSSYRMINMYTFTHTGQTFAV